MWKVWGGGIQELCLTGVKVWQSCSRLNMGWKQLTRQSCQESIIMIWCLQFALYPRLTWPLIMYEVALSRVEMIERTCNTYIRKWLGLPRTINMSSLYRQKGAPQLPLTSIVEIYKVGKIRSVMMLRESRDQEISDNPVSEWLRTLYGWRWRSTGCQNSEKVEGEGCNWWDYLFVGTWRHCLSSTAWQAGARRWWLQTF